jgi:hypothetical protein
MTRIGALFCLSTGSCFMQHAICIVVRDMFAHFISTVFQFIYAYFARIM